jgi:SecD/SecF fusion protein
MLGILLAGDQRYAKFVWGKPMIIKDASKRY